MRGGERHSGSLGPPSVWTTGLSVDRDLPIKSMVGPYGPRGPYKITPRARVRSVWRSTPLHLLSPWLVCLDHLDHGAKSLKSNENAGPYSLLFNWTTMDHMDHHLKSCKTGAWA
jgi:hypothetical protein